MPDGHQFSVSPGAFEAPRRLGTLREGGTPDFPAESVNSCLALYLTWTSWITYKLYRFTFIDTETCRTTIRWEMTLPEGIPTLPDSDGFLLPVGVFTRDQALFGIEAVDDSGAEVPICSSSEKRTLVGQMAELAKGSRSQLAYTLLLRELVRDQGVIHEGHSGDAVRKMQKYLKMWDSEEDTLKITGRFDPFTKKKVEEFQEDKELVTDGIVGAQTAERLIDVGLYRDPASEPIDPGPLTLEQRSAFSRPPTGYLQTVVMMDPSRRRRSLTLSYEARLQADTDPLTQPYVRDLRKAFFGQKNARPDGGTPRVGQGISVDSPVHRIYERKKSDRIVEWIQGRLKVPRTGTFDGKTVEAVKSFQGRHGLKQDGKVGYETISLLIAEDAPVGGMSDGQFRTLARSRFCRTQASVGPKSKGRFVRRLQEELKRSLPNSDLKEDGNFGDNTLEAVQEFQREYALRADGRVGRQTAAVLIAKRKVRERKPADGSGVRSFLRRKRYREMIGGHLSRLHGKLRSSRLVRLLGTADGSKLAISWPISGLGDAARVRIECVAPPELEIESFNGFWLRPSPFPLPQLDQGLLDSGQAEEEVPPRIDRQQRKWLANLCLPAMETQHTSSRGFLLPEKYDSAGTAKRDDDFPREKYAHLREDDNLDGLYAESTVRPPPSWRDQPALVMIFLRPRWEELRDGFIGLGYASSILILVSAVILLISGLEVLNLNENEVFKVTLATVVAFTASISTSILIQADKNEMAGFLLRPIRLRLALIGLIPLIGAATIALPFGKTDGVPALEINALILFGLALLELAYTRYCRWLLKSPPTTEEQYPTRAAVSERLASVNKDWVVREAELLRGYDFEQHDGADVDPITEGALAAAAQDFADAAGWKIEEV